MTDKTNDFPLSSDVSSPNFGEQMRITCDPNRAGISIWHLKIQVYEIGAPLGSIKAGMKSSQEIVIVREPS
jgi:hypothetical protein